jgi:hypothetical protein
VNLARPGRALAVLLLACVLTAWFLMPVSLRPASYGRLNTGDGQLSIWNVAWVAHALSTDPLNLYNANIFHPHTSTLAYSESNIGAGLLALPVWLWSRDAILAHNLVMLLSFVLAFGCTYALITYLTRAPLAGVVGATLFAFCPYMFARTAHIQLMMSWGLPASLLLFHRFVDGRSPQRAALLGLALFAQALSCAYYAVFAALLMGVGAVYYAAARRLWRTWNYWSGLALAGGLSVLLIAPFFAPYLRLQDRTGFGRSLADAVPYSANWSAWLASPARAHRWMVGRLPPWTDVLFPGFLLIGLGIAGLVLTVIARRRRPSAEGPSPLPPTAAETVGFYAVVGGLAAWASLGPKAGLYTWLYHTVPVFSLLRAPGRFGLLVALAMAVCAGFALARVAVGRPLARFAVGGMLVLLAVAELTATPVNVVPVPRVNPAYRVLASVPVRGPVAEFPFFYTRPDFPRHAAYMFNSTYHWLPLVNGYSDNIPMDFREMVLSVSTFPSRAAFRHLKARNTRYVVFHANWYDRRLRARLEDNLRAYEDYVRPLSRVDDVWLYEIVGWPD